MDSLAKSGAAGAEAVSGGPQAQRVATWLERGLIGCLFLLAVCAPHSIAATQTAGGLALGFWLARLVARPRPPFFRTPVDWALLGFFGWTVLAALLSYEPRTSIGKLGSASLFLIVYLVAQNVRERRTVRWLAVALMASCMINVVYTVGERAIGRGVKLAGMTAESPFRATGAREGDTILTVDGRRVGSLAEVWRGIALGAEGETARLQLYRQEILWTAELPRAAARGGGPTGRPASDGAGEEEIAAARLGVTGWARGRDWRAAGLYGHYTTYGEALLLIASLAFGLLVALRRKWSWHGAALALALTGMGYALLLTLMRASWLGFLISALVIVAVGARSRRAVFALLLAAALAVPVGLYVLQQRRNVGFLDARDQSTTWRATVWREGVELLARQPRHWFVGVGMDSIKRRWREWGMFDEGRLPMGHFHSTPLQLAVERGIPALLLWLAVLALYARTLWRLLNRRALENWIERGLALGALGGLAGFFVSGFVHYNLGDSEVAMIFYFLMGLTLALERLTRANPTLAARENLDSRTA